MQILFFQEFWFTAITTFLYFTAFTAMLADFAITADNPDEQYWYDAQVAAGVSFQNQFNNRYGFLSFTTCDDLILYFFIK